MNATCGNLLQHGFGKISHVSKPFNLVHGSVKMSTVTFSHCFASAILLFYAVQDYLGYWTRLFASNLLPACQCLSKICIPLICSLVLKANQIFLVFEFYYGVFRTMCTVVLVKICAGV